MGITNSNKQTDAHQIGCDGTLKVTLALSAAPDIVSNPTDIVLVLDRSGSMAGSPLANMKGGHHHLLYRTYRGRRYRCQRPERLGDRP